LTAEKADGYPPRRLAAIDKEVMKMSMPAKKTPAKSAQMKSARGASVSGEMVYVHRIQAQRSKAQSAPASVFVHHAAPAKSPSNQSKSSTHRVVRNKSATRRVVQPVEMEDDAFDRAIAEALKSGALDDMIAEALQEERDGKTTPL